MKSGALYMKWMISVAAAMILVAQANIKSLIAAAIYIVVLGVVSLFLPDLRQYTRNRRKGLDILAVALTSWAGYAFFQMWQPSSMMGSIAAAFGLSKRMFLFIASAVCAGIAHYSIWLMICVLFAFPDYLMKTLQIRDLLGQKQTQDAVSKRQKIFLLLTAAMVITICSKSSPLYPLNDWVDANCFFTTGKSMLHGKVLYKDIVEQKGFYLYMVYALGYLISNTGFFGVWLIEIASMYGFLYYAYRIAMLFCEDANMICAIPAMAAVVCGSEAFWHGGSVEELCLPLFAYVLWVGLKAIRYGAYPTQREFFLVGCTSGVVLWSKYTMLGVYVGWFAALAWPMIREQDWKRLGDSVVRIAAGVACVSLPVVLYFAANGALTDLWTVYFYDNIFLYSQYGNAEAAKGHAAVQAGTRVIMALRREWGLMLLVGVSLLWHRRAKLYKECTFLISCLVGMAVVTFAVRSSALQYYALIFFAFSALALPWMSVVLSKLPVRLRNKKHMFLFAGGGNTRLGGEQQCLHAQVFERRPAAVCL